MPNARPRTAAKCLATSVIEIVESAAEARWLLESGKRYDVTIIDGELLDGGGPILAAELSTRWTLPAIGIGSLAWRRQATDTDVFAALVTTPLRSNPLREALIAVHRGGNVRLETPHRHVPHDLGTETSPLRVLLAEDNPVNRLVALGMLRRLGLGRLPLGHR